LAPETTIGRSTRIGFLTIAVISSCSVAFFGSMAAAAASFFLRSALAGIFS